MKYLLFTLTFIAWANGLVFCQNVSFGAHLLGVYSTFKGPIPFFSEEDLSLFKTGLGLGANITYNLGKRFDLRGEVNLERKGANYEMLIADVNGQPTEKKVANHLDYLSVPIMVQMKFGNRCQILFNLGTAAHLLVHQQSDKIFTIEGEEVGIPGLDHIKYYHRSDFSILGGLGVAFPFLKTKKLYFDARYHHGSWDVTKEPDIFAGKNRAFTLQTGVQF